MACQAIFNSICIEVALGTLQLCRHNVSHLLTFSCSKFIMKDKKSLFLHEMGPLDQRKKRAGGAGESDTNETCSLLHFNNKLHANKSRLWPWGVVATMPSVRMH